VANVIGLDVGTHAVRAAELSLGRGDPVLRRFAQVTLPPGAVQNGEVVDPAAVAGALTRLWREGGFRRRDVIVGVANQRMVVRQAEVPMMTEEELRSSLQYQVQELIPIPVDEARMDFQILGETRGPGDEARLRILLVAAQRDMLNNLLAALDAANLQPRLVDAGPFALLRALDDPTADLESAPGEADAVVSVGAGVTTVVVVERGVPQFVRILVTGGADLTAAVASELDVDLETAEDLKRRADPESDDQMLVRAAALVEAQVGPLIEEVRGSLDFHLAQSSQSSIRRILVTGGGSRANDFVARLGEVMGVPAARADPLRSVKVGKTGLSDAQLEAARDIMTTAVGLALAALPPPDGVRRISLLPSEILVARVARRQVAVAAGAVGGLAALLLLLWAIRGGQVSDEQERAAEEEARAARARSEIAQLSDVEDLERLIGERRDLAAVALANDVSWPRLLQEVATVIPTDVWLTTFNGSSATGDVNFAGQGFDHTSSARWLLRLSDLPSLTGLWLPSSVKSEAGARSLVTFSSTGQLTPAARSDRLAEIQDAG
jgi:type IV pilus assembly protein PilM